MVCPPCTAPTHSGFQITTRFKSEVTHLCAMLCPAPHMLQCLQSCWRACVNRRIVQYLDFDLKLESDGQGGYLVYVNSPAWGLMGDMAGNVWQWTSSLSQPYPYQADDGRENLDSGAFRVLRGCSWHCSNTGLRSAKRGHIPPDARHDFIGVRYVRPL
jgi:hypothetical protein